IDVDLIENLKAKFPSISANIHHADFLKMDLKSGFGTSMGIIGNYPYNISSQILIKTIENRDIVPEMVGMFQKEVAERVTAKSGSKTYGRISVMVNAFYHTEYLFKVGKGAFSPPPKVDSAVIRLTRKDHFKLNCNERLFSTVVAASFNQRRKTIKNALKPLIPKSQHIPDDLLNKRAEQLSVDDFIKMTNYLDQKL
ncbi:MAG: ribosomal RNA small subunit methyltransferase A, partial [Bacteroidetes bacterium]|nr:ribosomal RNA small subunit methyltransferase A [Bacteroidota bacterium]